VQHATHLKPAKDDMKIGCSAIDRQLAVHPNRAPEPSKEKKEVADSHTTILEVRLSGIDLAK